MFIGSLIRIRADLTARKNLLFAAALGMCAFTLDGADAQTIEACLPEQDPGHALIVQADSLYDQEKFEEAAAFYVAAKEKGSCGLRQDAVALRYGEALFRLGRFEEAIGALRTDIRRSEEDLTTESLYYVRMRLLSEIVGQAGRTDQFPWLDDDVRSIEEGWKNPWVDDVLCCEGKNGKDLILASTGMTFPGCAAEYQRQDARVHNADGTHISVEYTAPGYRGRIHVFTDGATVEQVKAQLSDALNERLPWLVKNKDEGHAAISRRLPLNGYWEQYESFPPEGKEYLPLELNNVVVLKAPKSVMAFEFDYDLRHEGVGEDRLKRFLSEFGVPLTSWQFDENFPWSRGEGNYSDCTATTEEDGAEKEAPEVAP